VASMNLPAAHPRRPSKRGARLRIEAAISAVELVATLVQVIASDQLVGAVSDAR
jgi:hypothetical protein